MLSNDGFIVLAFGRAINIIQFFSIVEWMKKASIRIFLEKDVNDAEGLGEKKRKLSNFAVDIFMVVKWIFVSCVLIAGIYSNIIALLVLYLLFYNAFSYFLYHGWGSSFDPPKLVGAAALQRERKRLLSFLLAIFFSFVGFAYVYAVCIPERLEWPTSPNWLDAIYLSISNSFTLTYSGFQPLDQLARGALLLQVLNVLIFLTVLIGNSVPSVGRSKT
jgi:hypothetical protein